MSSPSSWLLNCSSVRVGGICNGVWQRLWCCNMLVMSSTVDCSPSLSVFLPSSSCSSLSFFFFLTSLFVGLIQAKISPSQLLYFGFNYFLEAIIWQWTFFHVSCRFKVTKSCVSSSGNNGLFGLSRRTTLLFELAALWLNWQSKQFQLRRLHILTCVCNLTAVISLFGDDLTVQVSGVMSL